MADIQTGGVILRMDCKEYIRKGHISILLTPNYTHAVYNIPLASIESLEP